MAELIKENIILFIPFVIMSVVTFIAFGVDKFKAIKGSFRISEATLLTLSLLGGAFGGIVGMLLFRHKTKKPKFCILMPLMLVGHILLLKLIV